MSERYEKGFFGGEKKSHSTFEKYQQLIVEHPNYASLPNKFNSLGKITWVKVKDSSRSLWWDGLKAEMELADRAGVARAIHPKELGGFKPCQVCGKKLSIHYVYPSAPALAKLNVALAPLSFEHFGEEISAIVAIAFEEQGSAGLEKIAMCFSYGQAF